MHVGEDVIADLDAFLTDSDYYNRKIFIMVDENTFKHCLPIILSKIEVLQEAEVIEVANGEANKKIHPHPITFAARR